MRRLTSGTAIGLTLVALAGCSIGKKMVHTDEIEQSAKTALAKKLGQTPKSIDCAHDVDAKVGASERCILTAATGTRIGLTATVKAVHGDRVEFDFLVGKPLAIGKGVVERTAKEILARKVGQTPKSIDCPHDLDAKVGASERCILTATDGTRIGLTVTLKALHGNRADYGVLVDKHPLPQK